MKNKSTFLIIIFLVLLPSIFASWAVHIALAQNNEPIVPSEPSNVYIEEIAEYDAPIGDSRPIIHLSGILYWERLAGIRLDFFINTTDIIESSFWDHDTSEIMEESDTCLSDILKTGCVQKESDRFSIVPKRKSFAYKIDAYYDPDIIKDTGMIVIFNSQSVDFSLEIDGEDVYAKVDYRNEIILPKGAGVVSAAPIDEGMAEINFTEVDRRVILVWEYKDRALDSKHDPLMIEVTYSYDKVYLAFTEQIYQQQQTQRERQEEQNRLDLLNASFIVIATLAIIASIISILFAYLLARKRFEPKLNQARELPRRSVTDIEASVSQKIPIKSMFMASIILLPIFFAPIPIQGQIETNIIGMDTELDLQKDPQILTETTSISIPVQRNFVYIYTDTNNTEFSAVDDLGNQLNWIKEDNKYKLLNPGFYFTYQLVRPYIVHDYSQILVFMDRIWSEFILPNENRDPEINDPYFNIDLSYSVLLPKDAYLYSASPSDLMEISNTKDGRWNVTFTDYNRRMDAFHDVFETQITYSFVDILEALDNLDADFYKDQIVIQNTEDLIDVVKNEILLFALLGLIAPLLSFIIAYWVFKKRYQKLIERMEKEQEENIFVENIQIMALSSSMEQNEGDTTRSFIGHYWRVIRKLSQLMHRDISLYDNAKIVAELKKRNISFDESLLFQVLTRGQEIEEEDEITYEELYDYANQVDLLLGEIQ